MAEAHIHIQVEESIDPQVITPLLTQESDRQNDQEAVLDKIFYRLGLFLSLLGFNHSSLLSFVLSWGAFLVIGVFLPVVMLELFNCNGCEKGQIKNLKSVLRFARLVWLLHPWIAFRTTGESTVLGSFCSLIGTMGMWRGLMSNTQGRFQIPYINIFWMLPCFLLKATREIIRIMYVHHESRTMEAFGERIRCFSIATRACRLRHYLSKISHRFRICLLLQFLILTISQFLTLFQTTGYNGIITFINGGDFAVETKTFEGNYEDAWSLSKAHMALKECVPFVLLASIVFIDRKFYPSGLHLN